MNNNVGQHLSFVELLQLSEIDNICIPVIQRDYAQGRKDTQATEIRNEFVASLKNAIETNELLTLDCIYGSIKERNFIPTDGQQRLTTLFLLHYYISVATGNLDSSLLNKFTYVVRDSAKEFCEALAANSIEITTTTPSIVVRNALWYHGGVFDNDPTIVGMLKMLDEIHVQFGTACSEEYYNRLFGSGSPVKFWFLSIDNFGFADDLFIKMNARGKSLTRFEMFKSEFETAITKSCDPTLVDEWKEKIDNDWLEFFWLYLDKDAPNNAENGLFRYIIFIGDTFYSWQKKSLFNPRNFSEDSDKIQYRNAIDALRQPKLLKFLCASLNVLNSFIAKDYFDSYKEIFKAIVFGNNLDFWKYAKLFAIIDYIVKFGPHRSDFSQFERVLSNLFASQREINKRDMIYNTSIDSSHYYSFTKGIDDLLVRMTLFNGDILKALKEGKDIIGLTGFSLEVEKSIFIAQFGEADILSLEQIPELCGHIQNFVSPVKSLIAAEKLSQFIQHKKTFLRLLQSYSLDEMLPLRVGYLWPLSLGENESKSFRKHRLWFNGSEYGDFLLTAGPGETKKWQQPLRALIADLSQLPCDNVAEEMLNLLQQRTDNLLFSNWYDYLVKYEEFFVSDEYCCCMLPEYSGGTGYFCLVSSKSWNAPYNPFCKALANKLGVRFSTIGDIKNVLRISNKITAEIMNDGNWRITIDGNTEIVSAGVGEDCIEKVTNYLTSKNYIAVQ